MRELKLFRVWNGMEMIYDVTVGKFGAFYVNPMSKGDGLDEKDSASLTPFNTRYSDGTLVMQFTGLLDKNGKEIYEGDRLRYSFLKINSTRILDDHGLITVESMFQFDVMDALKRADELEILGNIYQTPT